MHKLCLTLHRTFDGKVTVLYAGDNADEAIKVFRNCQEVGDTAVIRHPAQEYSKRLREQDVAPKADAKAKAKADGNKTKAKADAKAKQEADEKAKADAEAKAKADSEPKN